MIIQGNADLISFAKLYISNPDLAQKLINKYPVVKSVDYSTYFAGGEKGYIDYPFYSKI